MSIIKAYRHVHPQNNALSFDIKRMEDIYDTAKGKVDEPHRHDYYTIVLVKKANGKHILDFHEFQLAARQVYFVSPGQVHQIVEKSRSEGFALTFSPQFMVENGIDYNFIQDVHLFQDFGYSPPLDVVQNDLARLVQLAEEMYQFTHSDRKFKYQAVGALLQLFLIHCNAICSLSREENTQAVQASVSLLRNFKALLHDHFKTWHKVSDYASALHITPDYLNNSVKNLTGKSAKEHIQSRILIAAKRLLRFSDLQNKEIAYELGFSAPAHFSQFFKKCTGISPSKFSTM